jgi:predicted O-methyltransferase YrrM
MYSKFQLARKYLQYYITSANGRGHGIHSPFVFNFISKVLNDRREFYAYSTIEGLRQQLHYSKATVEVEDFGAGSPAMPQKERQVKDIAHWSLKPAKYAQLLFRIVDYYQPHTIIELGTSLGVTTAYLASANLSAAVTTFEGAPAIADMAANHFRQLNLPNIHLVKGNFDNTFAPALNTLKKIDLAFIDGNHRKEPTTRYFRQLLPYLHKTSIVIFDDIHWSREMEEAWEIIKKHSAVTCSIDLFFIGIIFFNTDFKEKQDFVIRF